MSDTRRKPPQHTATFLPQSDEEVAFDRAVRRLRVLAEHQRLDAPTIVRVHRQELARIRPGTDPPQEAGAGRFAERPGQPKTHYTTSRNYIPQVMPLVHYYCDGCGIAMPTAYPLCRRCVWAQIVAEVRAREALP